MGDCPHLPASHLVFEPNFSLLPLAQKNFTQTVNPLYQFLSFESIVSAFITSSCVDDHLQSGCTCRAVRVSHAWAEAIKVRLLTPFMEIGLNVQPAPG